MTKKLLIRQILIFVLSLLILVATILIFLVPATKNLLATRQRAKQISAEITKAKDYLEFLSEQNEQKARIDHAYEQALIYLPESSNQSNLILQLGEIGKATGTSVEKITIDNPAANAVPFALETTGSYQGLLGYITNLSKALRVNKLSSLDVQLSGSAVKAILKGQSFFSALPSQTKTAQQKLPTDFSKLDSLTHFGEPIKAQEVPGGSSEPFGTL